MKSNVRNFLAKSRDVTESTDKGYGREPQDDKANATYPGRHITEPCLVCTILYECVSTVPLHVLLQTLHRYYPK